jgi:Tfp pilus assembly protein PilE
MIERKDGFTVMELTVIMAIIGILIAIALPIYVSHKRTACDVSAEQAMKELLAPWQKYINDATNTKKEAPRNLQDLTGVYYGWSGGSAKCGVRFFYDTAANTVFGAALSGSRPRGLDTRYMFFFETKFLSTGVGAGVNDSSPIFARVLDFIFSPFGPRSAYAQANVIQTGIVTETDMASWVAVPGGQGCKGTAFDGAGNYVGCSP